MDIKKTVDSIEVSMQEMSRKYVDVLAEMKAQSHDIFGLKKHVPKRKVTVKEREVEKLKQQGNELEQYSRRQNLQVHGSPPHVN